MRRKWAALAGFVLAMAMPAQTSLSTAGAQPVGAWERQISGTTQDLSGVSFPDPLHGFAVGASGTILATADGGRTWSPQAACLAEVPCSPAASGRVTSDLSGVSFPDPLHGFAVGASGTILATADGGRTWPPQAACGSPDGCSPTAPGRVTSDLAGVSFPDPLHGFAVGAGGTILATVDGGRTWSVQRACRESLVCTHSSDDRVRADLAAVAFADARHGYAVGAGGTILSTRNGGRTWLALGACPAPTHCPEPERERADLRGVAVADGLHAWAVGAGGTVVTTTDGMTWTSSTCPGGAACGAAGERLTGDLAAVALADASHGRVVGSDGVTGRLGEGVLQPVPPALDDGDGGRPDLTDVAMSDATAAYAVGTQGAIYKATVVPTGLRVTEIDPRGGSTTGGTSVTVRGAGFTGATAVNFGRVSTTRFAVRSDDEIVVVAPMHAAGEVHVSVVTEAGASPGGAGGVYRYTEPVGGRWEPTSPCAAACRSGPAVLLETGEVLVVGSGAFFTGGAEPARSSSELYDPASGAWTATEPLGVARRGATATRLADGKVLVVGGNSPDEKPLASAELYDPATRSWEATGSLEVARLAHTATSLADGRVLVAGGAPFGDPRVGSAEIYDPVSGRWTATAPMTQGRSFHSATLLADGTVLVVGGYAAEADSAAATAEIYDPAGGRWSTTGAPAFAHVLHTATRLPGGSVLVAGGVVVGESSRESELYDPASRTWRAAASMAVPRALHSATLLGDGTVLVTGGSLNPVNGRVLPFVEVYDPTTNRWNVVGSMATPRDNHSTTLLDGQPCGEACGKVLVAGGADCRFCVDSTIASAELFTVPSALAAGSPGGGGGTGGAVAVAAVGALMAVGGAGAVAWRRSRRSDRKRR